MVRVTSGPTPYWAFIPNALPPSIDWTAELISKLSAADRALGQLAGVGRNLPNPHLLIGPFKRREAVLSSRIEGTQASLSDLLLFEAIPDAHPPVADVREVANYVEALEYGLARQTTLPMSLRLIREMHARLMAGVRGRERTPGEFRRAQNWIGPRDARSPMQRSYHRRRTSCRRQWTASRNICTRPAICRRSFGWRSFTTSSRRCIHS